MSRILFYVAIGITSDWEPVVEEEEEDEEDDRPIGEI